MHVIAKPAFVEFWTKYPIAECSLQAWFRTMESEVFSDFNVNGLTVFNVGGNKYRLFAAIHYNRHKVFIRAVLTHAEYDRGDWKRRK